MTETPYPVTSGLLLSVCPFLVLWMMSEQDLADVVQIAVEDLSPDHPGTAVRQSMHCCSPCLFSIKATLPDFIPQ